MRRGRGWISMMVMMMMVVAVLAFGDGAVFADEAQPVPGAAPEVASEATCTTACRDVIARCAGVFGPAMGDMRPFCTKSVVRRCRAMGVAVCDSSAGAR
jgi:hypothetical protein